MVLKTKVKTYLGSEGIKSRRTAKKMKENVSKIVDAHLSQKALHKVGKNNEILVVNDSLQ